MRVGVEVGGTFTDLIVTRDGKVSIGKVPSTPDSPDVGAINAIEAAGINLAHVTELVHGSTVATNAVLERKGGHVGVLVTSGTRDLFALQRHDRSSIYDLHYKKPPALVNRLQVLEIEERMAPDGSVITEPDRSRLSCSIAQFIRLGKFDAIAICLLNSYANPQHEQMLCEIVNAISPQIPVTCSCDVAPEFREYERASTTVLAAYVQPIIDRYLTNLVQEISARGFKGRFSVMQSNGGRLPARAMSRNAVTALYSGPAAGVVGAVRTASRAGYGNLITLDMGGTSTDVSLIVDGAAQISPQTRIDGLPIRTPVIDMTTVGAGGGSIAWVDDGGMLRVGPRSAGALPGPACYDRGGTEPTVTDAHLLRGSLQPKSFLRGTMTIDPQAARQAFADLSECLDLSVIELADATIRIAEANIVRAIQQVSTERGHDPRDFVLVPFGGAGGLHAARVAQELGISQIVVPDNSGVLSAVGLLASDYTVFRTRTERVVLTADAGEKIQSILLALRDQAKTFLESESVTGDFVYEPALEMRYVGQAFEITVGLSGPVADLTVTQVMDAFAKAHHRVFEFSKPPDKAVEIVTFRIAARAVGGELPLPDAVEPADGSAARIAGNLGTIELIESGAVHNCKLLTREAVDKLVPASLCGPALIEDGTSTIYVPPEWSVRRDDSGNLIMQTVKQEG